MPEPPRFIYIQHFIMKIIRNTIIPVKGYKAINLCGILFARKEAALTEADLNHERIHTAQMRELAFIGFYIIYLAEWLAGLCKGMTSNKAYHAISFEREAYGNEDNPDYLASRRKYAQWK